jgi:hypothetical protein
VDPDDEEALAAVLGFSGFGSTKGQKIEGNEQGAADVQKKRRQYRQYLFVKGAYNVPLTKPEMEEYQAKKEQRKLERQQASMKD